MQENEYRVFSVGGDPWDVVGRPANIDCRSALLAGAIEIVGARNGSVLPSGSLSKVADKIDMISGENKSERTLAATAYHEAGHAVIGVLVERLPLSATIEPDGTGVVGKVDFEADAPLQARRYFDDSLIKRAYARARVLGELAGSIAHDIAEPNRKRDGADDHDDYWSRELAREMVSWEDSGTYVEAARQETYDLLHANWPAVEALAQALLEKRTMQRDEILATVRPHIKLPNGIA